MQERTHGPEGPDLRWHGEYRRGWAAAQAENARLRAEVAAMETADDGPWKLAAVTADRDRLRALLARYRDETPLGHQPHMIAAEADAALGRLR